MERIQFPAEAVSTRHWIRSGRFELKNGDFDIAITCTGTSVSRASVRRTRVGGRVVYSGADDFESSVHENTEVANEERDPALHLGRYEDTKSDIEEIEHCPSDGDGSCGYRSSEDESETTAEASVAFQPTNSVYREYDEQRVCGQCSAQLPVWDLF